MLEVCIDSLESAINAIHGGADELEVCSSLPEGGLTPSIGLVKEIFILVRKTNGEKIHKTCKFCNCPNHKNTPKINIMIRCRAGSDFNYTDLEVETMLADIEVFKEMGVDRFVFGALTTSMTVDRDTCSKIINKASPLPVTFHRAFDLCDDVNDSIENIIDIGFDRLLTSGQKPSASEAIDILSDLHKQYCPKITIMPGAGINPSNVSIFLESGFHIVHSSCKITRVLPTGKCDLGLDSSNFVYVTDENIVANMKQILACQYLS